MLWWTLMQIDPLVPVEELHSAGVFYPYNTMCRMREVRQRRRSCTRTQIRKGRMQLLETRSATYPSVCMC